MTNYEYLFFSLLIFVIGIVKTGSFARMLNIYFSFLMISVFFIFNGSEETIFMGVAVVTFSSVNFLLWMSLRKKDVTLNNGPKEDI